MFCCSPQPLILTLAEPTLNFEIDELYEEKAKNFVRDSNNKQPITAECSLYETDRQKLAFRVGSDNDSKFIFQLSDATHELHISQLHYNQNQQPLWRVLTEGERHKIEKGDRVKVGLSQFTIYSHFQTQKASVKRKELKGQEHCRYCFHSEYTLQDPLIGLCKCSGSVKYLHLECLRNWLMSKMDKQTRDNVTFFVTKPQKLKCQLCKSPWPLNFRHEERNYPLFSLQVFPYQEQFSPDSAYLVLLLESLDQEQEQISIFVRICMDDEFLIGTEDNDEVNMSLDTLGVSPLHCSLYRQNKQFFIKDCGSLAGTPITLSHEQTFTSKKGILLQYKRVLVGVKEAQSFWSCFNSQVEYKIYFHKMSR